MSPSRSALLTRLQRRHQAFAAVRSFLFAEGFYEADTPLIVKGPGLEPHIDPLAVKVRTDFSSRGEERWLITSPELSLKRIVAAGAERVFQLGHVFRDGEKTKRHEPEFTLLEWYRARGNFDDLVRDHELICTRVAEALGVDAPLTPFDRTTVADLFETYAHIDLRAALVEMNAGDPLALVRRVKAVGETLRPGADFEDAFFQVMTNLVEPKIGVERPIVVVRWPAQMAVLARRCDDDALFAERFEIYAGGLELSNAFDELTDAVEQRARFVEDNATRKRMGKVELPLDEDFLADLPRMPRTVGCALGVDRLLMLLLKAADIDDVTLL